MKQQWLRMKEKGKLILAVLLALAAVQFIFACEEPAGPERDPACGTGSVSWDVKAGVCRDLGRDGTIVPESCCGR